MNSSVTEMMEMIAEELKAKGGRNPTFKDVEIVREGKQITLPKSMSYHEGIKWLQRKRDEEETPFSFCEEIDCFPLEGALALTKAVRNLYGFAQSKNTPGMFGSKPPRMIGVNTPSGVQQAIWGRLEIPGMDGYLDTGFCVIDSTRVGFKVNGMSVRKYQPAFTEL